MHYPSKESLFRFDIEINFTLICLFIAFADKIQIVICNPVTYSLLLSFKLISF